MPISIPRPDAQDCASVPKRCNPAQREQLGRQLLPSTLCGDVDEAGGAFPRLTEVRKTSNVAMASKQISRHAFGQAREGSIHPEVVCGRGPVTSRKSVGSTTFTREKTNGKVGLEIVTVPTKPLSPRTTTSRFRELHVSLGRTLTRIFGLDSGRDPTSRSDEPVALPWEPHENVSKKMNYRPRGHGRAFSESYEYDMGKVLGSGGFGLVVEGRYKPDGEKCAVKVLARRAVSNTDALVQEVVILRSLDHRQIVSFLDFYEDPSTFYLVLEMVLGGDLFDQITSQGRFGEGDARACVRSLLEPLAYCHSRRIVHRDIKPENIMMATLDAQDRTIKLVDFGLAASLAEGPAEGPPCGTPTYMAPERLNMIPHGTAVDCWSVGVVTYILLGGYPPFCSSKMEKLFRLIKKGRVNFDDSCWGAVSQQAKDLILALMVVDPTKRISAEQALRHPWLTENGDSARDAELSLNKLRIFNAKKKLRMGINTIIACQQLHGFAQPMLAPEHRVAREGDQQGQREKGSATATTTTSSPTCVVPFTGDSADLVGAELRRESFSRTLNDSSTGPSVDSATSRKGQEAGGGNASPGNLAQVFFPGSKLARKTDGIVTLRSLPKSHQNAQKDATGTLVESALEKDPSNFPVDYDLPRTASRAKVSVDRTLERESSNCSDVGKKIQREGTGIVVDLAVEDQQSRVLGMMKRNQTRRLGSMREEGGDQEVTD